VTTFAPPKSEHLPSQRKVNIEFRRRTGKVQITVYLRPGSARKCHSSDHLLVLLLFDQRLSPSKHLHLFLDRDSSIPHPPSWYVPSPLQLPLALPPLPSTERLIQSCYLRVTLSLRLTPPPPFPLSTLLTTPGQSRRLHPLNRGLRGLPGQQNQPLQGTRLRQGPHHRCPRCFLSWLL
jgi:hypothetical protein